ncbi:ankyrin [Anaeromyces robustus]|uniref:Ankyrin n=1 Tax=Anaeromyces robustus TaxID=1754192 RepID=A0A1Y1WNH2_9FUNG|nr:ankyrin [Anaeromyces robustus]|eukprot:ORX75099.1 ankyrin [Anaeromyces robustus]
MEFDNFKHQLLLNIKNNDNSYHTIIKQNNHIISEYLNRPERLEYVKSFINGLINIIIDTNDSNDFHSIEYLLNLPIMNLVLEQFKQSNIIFRACDESSNYKNIINWALTMNINLYSKDELGHTALMGAVTHYNLGFLVDLILEKCTKEYANSKDINGNTALFYAIPHIQLFKKLLDFGLDYNHVNMDGDNVLMYACKKDKLQMFDILIKKPDFNIYQNNNVGKNLAMLLIEKKRGSEFKMLTSLYNIDINYKNRYNETLLSTFIKTYYSFIDNKIIITENFKYKQYYTLDNLLAILKILIQKDCDFNIVLDDDGNTPIIFFMLIKDYFIIDYLLKNNKNIDLSMKNKYGVNASYLMLFIQDNKKNNINKKHFYRIFMTYPTFDYSYLDSYGNSFLIHSIIREDSLSMKFLMNNKFKMISKCNNKKENCLIIATKLGKFFLLTHMIVRCSDLIDVNHTDELGNTALYYAIKLKDKKAIQLLLENKANPDIPNIDGITALDAAKEMNDPDFLEFIQNYLSTSDKNMKNTGENELNSIEKDNKVINTIEQQNKTKKSILKNFKNIIKKKENIDEKLDNYIKNYRITSYQKEYEYLLKYEYVSNYRPSSFYDNIQKWTYEMLFEVVSE